MKHFNKGRPINDVFKSEIERFFSYKWINDHNQAIDDDWEIGMLDQLPVSV